MNDSVNDHDVITHRHVFSTSFSFSISIFGRFFFCGDAEKVLKALKSSLLRKSQKLFFLLLNFMRSKNLINKKFLHPQNHKNSLKIKMVFLSEAWKMIFFFFQISSTTLTSNLFFCVLSIKSLTR
jgi:hypothetical protein